MACYICCEDTEYISPCQCNGLPLCQNCLEKLRIYKFKTCTICNYPYPPPEGGYEEEFIMTKEEINLILDRLESQDSMWHLLPVHCRPRTYREKRMFCLEIIFHSICVYTLSCIASQIEHPSLKWYAIYAFHSFIFGILAYLSLLGIANSICIKR